MDPVCCLLGICCPPFSAEQEATFEKFLNVVLADEKKAKKIAKALAHDLGKLSEQILKMSKEDA